MDTKIILSTPPEYLQGAMEHGRTLAHMAYKIGSDFHLYRSNIPLSLRGGLMVLGDNGYSGSGDVDFLAGEIVKECIYKGFDGVVLDFDASLPVLHSLAAVLSTRLKRQGGELYLPEEFAGDSDWAKVIINTAISGGSLTTRLKEVTGLYGRKRIALEIERVRMDFCLPSLNGSGKRLTARELYSMIQSRGAQSYFSQELCAYYFTFQDKKGSHFVLYDDAGSIKKKIYLASQFGISSAMLLYPEVEDLISKLT